MSTIRQAMARPSGWKAPGRCWPTAEQELLLRASLLSGEQAIAAWRLWQQHVRFEDIDLGSNRMLPMLYANLVRHQVQDPVLDRYKGVLRKAWYENQLLIEQLLRLGDDLAAAGVDVMALKGASLILAHYEGRGLRPMGDLDLLVRPQQAGRAFQVLLSRGYRPHERSEEGLTEGFVAASFAQAFTQQGQVEIDLQWHVFHNRLQADADEPFWAAKRSLGVGERTVHVMGTTDLLFHVCVHGVAWNVTPPFRWVADAIVLLRGSKDEIDWQRLTWNAGRLDLTLPLRQALEYLTELLGPEIPAAVLSDIRSLRPSLEERLGYLVAIEGASRLGVFEPLWQYYVQHFRPRRRARGLVNALLTFPHFLQARWGLGSVWDVPLQAIVRTAQRLRGDLKSRETGSTA